MSWVNTGCMNSFYTYSERIQPTRRAYSIGNKTESLKVPNDYIDSSDKQLYLLESAKINQGLLGIEESKKSFESVFSEFKAEEDVAEYSVTNALKGINSLIINDNAMDYSAPEFERIMAYTYQSLNHLLRIDVNSAEVDSRKALNEQRFFQQKKEDDIEEMEVTPATNQFQSDLTSRMSAMNKVATRASNKYENPMTYFLAGIISEVQGDYNDAVVSYKKALKVMPGSPFFTKSIIGVERTHFRNSQTFSELLFPEMGHSHNTGELIVIVDHNLIPQKQEVKIPFPTGSGIAFLAFPVYKKELNSISTLQLSIANKIYSTETICNLYGIAAKNLQDEVVKLVVKSISRVTIKVAAQVAMRDQFGDWGVFLSTLWNIASERADTRGWSLLPQDIQALRQPLSPGVHKLQVNGTTDIEVSINDKRKTLLYINWVGNNITYKSVNL